MLVFAQSLWLWLLPLPLLILWLGGRVFALKPKLKPKLKHGASGATLLHPRARLLAALASEPRRRAGLRRLLWTTGCLLLILALARPQWLDFSTPPPRPGHDIMIAIDVSGSMRALDFTAPGEAAQLEQRSRLEIVKKALEDFLAQRRNDRIGVILFGDHAAVHVPPTTDLALVRQLLADIRPGILGERTALGDAIALAVARLAAGVPDSRILLLFSDGANTAGTTSPETALAEARRLAVRIFAVGVGTEEKVLFPRGPVMAPEVTELPPDTALLQRLAGTTGGAFYHAASSQDMTRILGDIDALVPVMLRDPRHARREDWFALPLLGGLALLLASFFSRRVVLP